MAISLCAFHSTKIIGTNFRNFCLSNGTRLTASQNSRSRALPHRACWVKLCCCSSVHVSSRSVGRLRPTALANGTQNFRQFRKFHQRGCNQKRIPKFSEFLPFHSISDRKSRNFWSNGKPPFCLDRGFVSCKNQRH